MNEHSRVLERDKLDIAEPLSDVESAAAGGAAARALSDRDADAGRPPADPRRRPARDAAGRPPARPRADQIHRRLSLPRHAVRAHQARRHRVGPHQAHRHQRGRGHARRDGGAHRQGNSGQFLRAHRSRTSRCWSTTIVFHAGDGVAAVAAVTEQIANEALDKIVVEYEPLPAVLDPVAAMREDSPKVHAPNSNIYATKVIRKGDVEKGFAESDHIFEGRFSHADDRARVARAARGHRRLGRQRPPHDLCDHRAHHARACRHGAHAEAADEPHPHHRHHRRRQFRRQERDHAGAGAGAAVEEDRPAGEGRVHARRGVHLDHHASPHHHGLQDRRHEERPHPGAPDSPGARRRRLLLVERDHARQGLHSGARPLQDRQRSCRRPSSSTPTRP